MTRIRYYLDENVTDEIAGGLRSRGVDVLTTQEAGNKGLLDAGQIQFALDQMRVTITHDWDMFRLDSQGIAHAGIAYRAKQSRTVKQMLRRLMSMDAQLSAEDMLNHIEYL